MRAMQAKILRLTTRELDARLNWLYESHYSRLLEHKVPREDHPVVERQLDYYMSSPFRRAPADEEISVTEPESHAPVEVEDSVTEPESDD